MLTAAENNSVSDSDPNIYLVELMRTHGTHAGTILESNLMPPSGAIDYATASYSAFTAARSDVIAKFIG